MKNIISLLSILTLTVYAADKSGTFKATMGDRQYNVPITCHNFENNKFNTEFIFASDDGMAQKDTNGDGIIVRGDRIVLSKKQSPIEMDGMTLTIIDNGIHYESSVTETMKKFNKTPKWSKTSNGIKGTSELVKENEMKGTLMHYEVICK